MLGLFNNPVKTISDGISGAGGVISDIVHLDVPKTSDLLQMVDAGLTVAEISALTGISRELVSQILED